MDTTSWGLGLWCYVDLGKLDVPGQEFFDSIDRVVGNPGEHVAEVGFWIDPVQFRSSNQAIHRGGTFASGVGSGKQKVLPAQGDTTQSTFGRVVVDFQVAIGAIPEQMESSGQARNGWRRQVPISWTPSTTSLSTRHAANPAPVALVHGEPLVVRRADVRESDARFRITRRFAPAPALRLAIDAPGRDHGTCVG